jgi:phosphonate transport system substrate-binding protein
MNRFHGGVLWALLAWVCVLTSCSRAPEEDATAPQYGTSPSPQQTQEMVLAVHPLHNPQKLHEVFGPLIDHLNLKVPGIHFTLEASRDYAAYNAKLYNREFHFALPNPYQTINAMKHGYHVFAKMGNDRDFRGIIIVRKDSGIRAVSDLRGKAVSYPAPTALAACMMPQYFLQTQGLDVMRDIENRYVGSQESSIMNVFLNNTAAGATWPPPWRAFEKQYPDKAAQLEVIWETQPLINNSFMARDDIPPAIIDAVRKALLALGSHDKGRAILKRMETCCIDVADDSTYKPVEIFVEEFGRKVRPLTE